MIKRSRYSADVPLKEIAIPKQSKTSKKKVVKMASDQRHALVVGASGITGCGLLHSLLCYPTPEYWTRITGLTSRPIDKGHALLRNEERLHLISGLDLNTTDSATVVAFLKAIPQVDLVSAKTTFGNHY